MADVFSLHLSTLIWRYGNDQTHLNKIKTSQLFLLIANLTNNLAPKIYIPKLTHASTNIGQGIPSDVYSGAAQ